MLARRFVVAAQQLAAPFGGAVKLRFERLRVHEFGAADWWKLTACSMLASFKPCISQARDRPLDVPARQLTVGGCFKQRRHRLNNPGDGITNIITAGGLGDEFVKLFSCFDISLEQTLRPRRVT